MQSSSSGAEARDASSARISGVSEGRATGMDGRTNPCVRALYAAERFFKETRAEFSKKKKKKTPPLRKGNLYLVEQIENYPPDGKQTYMSLQIQFLAFLMPQRRTWKLNIPPLINLLHDCVRSWPPSTALTQRSFVRRLATLANGTQVQHRTSNTPLLGPITPEAGGLGLVGDSA